MLSYWEKQSFLHYDFIVIGSGIVGLSTALSIREERSDAQILVLERGLLPTGASTKNAGFACVGSLTEILEDLEMMPVEEVLQLVQLRWNGLLTLRARVGDKRLGYCERGSYELISKDETGALDKMEKANDLLSDLLPKRAFDICKEDVSTFGFSEAHVKELILNNNEGELHTGMMMKSLIELCLEKKIEFKTGCLVSNIEEEENSVRITASDIAGKNEIHFSAERVAVCTNAFTKSLIPELDLEPGRGLVLVTEPIRGLKFKGIYHFDRGYYYFREIDGRVLFGGGRNSDKLTEATTDFSTNEKILNDLKEKLSSIILPEQEYRIAYHWTGIMAFGSSKFPIIKMKGNRIAIGVRMGGMGVAIGSKAGEMLADIMLGDANSR